MCVCVCVCVCMCVCVCVTSLLAVELETVAIVHFPPLHWWQGPLEKKEDQN